MWLIAGILAFAILSPASSVNGQVVFDVTKYGAKGDGRTDDTWAFQKVWELACHGSKYSSVVALVPSWGKFLLHSAMFKGPCNANFIKVQLDGHIIAPIYGRRMDLNEGTQWVTFRDVNNLDIGGQGSIDGGGQRRLPVYQGMEQGEEEKREDLNSDDEEDADEQNENTDDNEDFGKIYSNKYTEDENKKWTSNGPRVNDGDKPTNVAFFNCRRLRIYGISSTFSVKNHVSISQCVDVIISNVHLRSPGESKNTDGIDISHSSWITIKDSEIHTGDDCIEINSGTNNINISNIHCGPGHGISIGSFKGKEANVEKVLVQHCTFTDTQNGARIKTFPDGIGGNVRSIAFESITLINVKRPIVIDQFYNDMVTGARNNPPPLNSPVQISDVRFTGFDGTCSGDEAIYLKCNGGGCNGITLRGVHIKGSKGQPVHSVCSNVRANIVDTWPAVRC